MSKQKGHKLEEWEIALIRAMWASKKFTKQEIHPYFTRTDRPINQARISQIADGKIYTSVPAASEKQLQAFLNGPRDPQSAKQRFLQEDPWHSDNLAELLRCKSDAPSTLAVGETDTIECKQSFSWDSRGAYARIIAGFANNRGGYLLFGVSNDSKEVIGINKGKLDGIDSAKITQFLNQKLSPAVRWDKRELACVEKTVGAIYVWPAASKPIICTQDHQADLKEGDVYFRYVGQTGRIRYAELAKALEERDQRLHQRWMDVFTKVAKAGVQNVAILNTMTGELSGAGASYLIDEGLIPSLKFLREGEFEEKKGAPALKLVGIAQPVILPGAAMAATVVEKAGITDRDILDTFIGQKKVVNPSAYILQLCHMESKWLPVYYFIREAGLTLSAALKLLKEEPTHSPNRRDRQIDRIKTGAVPGRPSLSIHESIRKILIAKDAVDVSTPQKALAFLKGVRTLNAAQIDPKYVLSIMKSCFDQFYEGANDLSTEIRYAASHVDAKIFRVK